MQYCLSLIPYARYGILGPYCLVFYDILSFINFLCLVLYIVLILPCLPYYTSVMDFISSVEYTNPILPGFLCCIMFHSYLWCGILPSYCPVSYAILSFVDSLCSVWYISPILPCLLCYIIFTDSLCSVWYISPILPCLLCYIIFR